MDYTCHKSLMESEKNYPSVVANSDRFCIYDESHKSLGIQAKL